MRAEIEFREPATEGLVTCVVPVYDGERFLAEALDSALAQDYEPMEIVVVDDGSTDGTPDVAAGYGDRIRYLRQENAGPSAARNRGLEASRGEFVSFLDADDLWVPGKTTLQVETLRERPGLDWCVGHVQNFWMEELAEEERQFEGRRFSEERLPGYSLDTLLARRSAFEVIGGLDPDLRTGEDNDWFLRARDSDLSHLLLPDLLARRRLHAGNLTRRDLASRDTLLQNLKASLDRRRGDDAS